MMCDVLLLCEGVLLLCEGVLLLCEGVLLGQSKNNCTPLVSNLHAFSHSCSPQ